MTPGIEFNSRLGDIPDYPSAGNYDFGGDLVKLASNESPFGPPAAVVGAIQGRLETLNRYPDPDKSALRKAIGDRAGIGPERVTVGNGSCEILLSAADALLEPGAELIYAWPAFSVYPMLASTSGATEIRVPLDSEACHDLEAMTTEITAATRLILICNPNNPTGTALPPEEIDAFLETVPDHVAVILDEAYVEFNLLQDPDDSLDLLAKHSNLILLRTFSKIYGLCGLRAGYALGPERFRRAIDQVRQPFSVNALAQAAAAEAVSHQDEIARRVEATVIERVHMESELAERGLEYAESQANFIWMSVGDRDEGAIVKGLADRGVIVRAGAALGEEGRLRVTFGTRRENDRFLAELDQLL